MVTPTFCGGRRSCHLAEDQRRLEISPASWAESRRHASIRQESGKFPDDTHTHTVKYFYFCHMTWQSNVWQVEEDVIVLSDTERKDRKMLKIDGKNDKLNMSSQKR